MESSINGIFYWRLANYPQYNDCDDDDAVEEDEDDDTATDDEDDNIATDDEDGAANISVCKTHPKAN